MIEAVAETVDVRDDATLIKAVRGGDVAAYGVLYERHRMAARRVAASLGVGGAEQDDLVAEGFARVLRILRSGGGPDETFRPYLLTTMRNALISWRRRDSTVSLVPELPEAYLVAEDEDPVETKMHATVAANAFASLPERWRMVLWRTEIEGETPAQVARLLGMTPNGVAALAYRAREGLRQAYLEQHLPVIKRQACRVIAAQLAGWVRQGVAGQRTRRITAHLERCPECRELATGLKEINQELPGAIVPIILGMPAVVAQWATGTGVSTASWLTTVKTVVAGAAVATTAAVGVAAVAPVDPPDAGADVVSVPVEHVPQPGPTARRLAPVPSPAPTAPPVSTPPAVAPPAEPPVEVSVVPTTVAPDEPVGQAPVPEATPQSEKGAKKDAKQEAKTAKKEAKQEAKEDKKEAKQEVEEAKQQAKEDQKGK